MAVGGVSGNNAQLELQKLDQQKDTQKAGGAHALNNDLQSQAQRMDKVREQVAAQQMQQDAMRMFQQGGSPGSHAKTMEGISKDLHPAINHIANTFMESIRATVTAQLLTGMARTASSDTSAQPQETESSAKQSSSSGGTSGLGHAGSSQSMGNSGGSAYTSGGSMDDPAVQQVMQGAMSGVYSQLYGIVNKMQSTRQDKATLGNIDAIYNQAIATGQDPVKGVPQYNISFDSQTGKLSVTYAGTKDMTQAQLTAAKQNVDNTKDSMSEMSTMDQMTLQQAMEQKGQFESVFSNMLKTYQSTASGVLANLKD